MQRPTQGFSLVELMVALAVLAVLASLSVPAYQDYIRRTRVAETLAIARVMQDQIADNVANGLPFTNAVRPQSTKYAYLWPNPGNGHVDITFFKKYFNGTDYHLDMWLRQTNDQGVVSTISPGTIPQGRITWECKGESNPSAQSGYMRLPAKWAPPHCR